MRDLREQWSRVGPILPLNQMRSPAHRVAASAVKQKEISKIDKRTPININEESKEGSVTINLKTDPFDIQAIIDKIRANKRNLQMSLAEE